MPSRPASASTSSAARRGARTGRSRVTRTATRAGAMPSESRRHPTGSFDAVAESYDAWYATPVGQLVDRLEKDAVFRLVGTDCEGVVLDLSCGTGNPHL